MGALSGRVVDPLSSVYDLMVGAGHAVGDRKDLPIAVARPRPPHVVPGQESLGIPRRRIDRSVGLGRFGQLLGHTGVMEES